MAQSILPIHIIAEPKESYRERYSCEVDPNRNRTARFIRADANPHNLDYPTIEVSQIILPILLKL